MYSTRSTKVKKKRVEALGWPRSLNHSCGEVSQEYRYSGTDLSLGLLHVIMSKLEKVDINTHKSLP